MKEKEVYNILLINNIPPDYKLIKYENKILTLKNDLCGHTFSINKDLYKKRKQYGIELCIRCCPIKNRIKLPKQSIRKYKIIENIAEYIKLLHKKCGNEIILDKDLYKKRKQYKHELCTICNPIKKNKSILLSNLTDQYELITSNKHILSVKHLVCNNEFTIKRHIHKQRRKRKAELCIICNPMNSPSSTGEKELSNYIRSIYNGTISLNTRKIISPYELDIFLPELNLAFEFNGTRIHADPRKFNEKENIIGKNIGNRSVKDIWEKDKLKHDICQSRGIKLVIIWEMDWIHNNKLVLKTVKDAISKTSKFIYGHGS